MLAPVGRLLPEDFSYSSLANDAERDVVRRLCDQLRDSWLVLPDVSLRAATRDHQLDIVLVHQDHGVLDLEVKGHRVEVVEGVWRCSGSPLNPQPFQQATSNAYALRNRLQRACDLPHLRVECAVAFPNTTSVSGRLPPSIDRAQLLLAPDLDDVEDALVTLMTSRSIQALSIDDVEAIVHELLPDVSFGWDPMAQRTSARNRLDEICDEQIKALQTLDANRRVVVTGAAGTGKSRLAAAWARRAWVREERTLLTCYNEPLAATLRARLPDDEALHIGAFLRMGLALDGMEPLEPPADAGDTWWNVQAVGHMLRYWHQVTVRFDTIVVDEAQDFSPAWIAALEMLLDPGGPQRMLVVADERQVLYPRGFSVPRVEDGWTQAELVTNCRNTHEIARLLRTKLDGAPSPINRPGAVGVRGVEVADLDEAIAAVATELARLGEEEAEPASILVETTSSRVRAALWSELELVRWEDRADGIVCENVHRVKGLDVDTVILVCLDDDVDDNLLYVGISRAVSALTVVGSPAVVARLGLAAAP